MNKRENNKVTKRRVPRAEISKQMKGGPDEENITETTPSLAPNPSNKPTNFFIKNRAIIGFIITGVVAITLVLCYFSFNPSPAPEIRNQADSEVASFYPPQPRKLPEDKTQISSAPDFTDQVSKSQTLYNLEKFPIAGLIQSKDGESKFGCYATPVDLSKYTNDTVIATAAHCNDNYENAKISEIFFYDQSEGKVITVNSSEFDVIPHPNFKLGNHTHGYDVALIILKHHKITQLAQLPMKGQKLPHEFIWLKFSGSDSLYPTHVIETQVKLVPWRECVRKYPDYKDYRKSDRFCAQNGVRYSEVGYSGSSLHEWNGKNYVIYGIYSAGASEGFTKPDMYMQLMSADEIVATFNLI